MSVTRRQLETLAEFGTMAALHDLMRTERDVSDLSAGIVGRGAGQRGVKLRVEPIRRSARTNGERAPFITGDEVRR